MDILLGGDREIERLLRERLTEAVPDADVSTRRSPAAILDRLDRRSIDWLVLDYATERFPADYLDAVHDRVPDCSVVLLADEPLDAIRAPVTLDVTVIRYATPAAGTHDDLTRRVVSTIRRATSDGHAGLTQLFNEHALPMLLIDPATGAILDTNSAAVDFYGYTLAELTAMSIDDINTLDPEDVAARREQAVDSAGRQFTFEHRTKTGELRTVEVNSTPVEYDDRTVLFSIIQDVTPRTEAERRLRDAKLHYERLAEQNVAGIYIIEDRVFTYVNPKMAEIFGTTPEEMSGSSVFEYIADSDTERVRERIAAREDDTAQSFHYTFAGERPDGEPVILEAHGGRLETRDGVQIIGTLLDITERETQERELRRLSQALEYAAPAVYITDVDGAIEYVNPAFERITGYSEAEALGRGPRIIKSGQMTDIVFR